MKKILAFLTGAVLLITILAAGACGRTELPKATKNMSVVIIYVKAVSINGENHLKMYDSNEPDSIKIDSLITEVEAGTDVYWVLAEQSGLEKIRKIKPKSPGGQIFHKNATGYWSQTRYKKHKVPDNAQEGEEAYLIRVKDLEGNKWEIDPYLRIRPR